MLVAVNRMPFGALIEEEGEEEDREEDSSASAAEDVDDVPWDCIDPLVRGRVLLKFGRAGDPHFRTFQLSTDCLTLSWGSAKQSGEVRLPIKGCSLLEGQQSDVFRRAPRPDLADVSFTVVYDDPTASKRSGSAKRTLDVACKDRGEYEETLAALTYLIAHPPPEALLEARRRSLWSDVVPLAGSSNTRLAETLKRRLKDGNDVLSWGRSGWGTCGLGDEGARLEPTIIPSLLGKAIRSVSVGAAHCIALTLAGEALAWGNGGCGRLGTGGTDHELSPRPLLQPGGREPWRFKSVACGDMHSLGVGLEGGAVFAWGCGGNGQLGLGGRDDRVSPAPVPAFLTGIFPPALGGGAKGYGRASMAEGGTPLKGGDAASHRPRFTSTVDGIGAYAPAVPERIVAMLPSVVSVAAGAGYSAFVDSTGRLYTCGIQAGPLGHDVALVARLLREGGTGTLERGSGGRGRGTSPTPGPSEVGVPAPSITPGPEATARAFAAALAFVGGGATTAASDLLSPLHIVSGLDGGREQAISVAAGELHVVLATSTGSAYSWGWGGTGALGHGDVMDCSLPSRIAGLPRHVVQVAAGAAHTLALVENRTTGAREVHGCGCSLYGQVFSPTVAVEEEGSGAGRRGTAGCVTVPTLLRLPLPPGLEEAAAGGGSVPSSSHDAPSPIAVAAGAWHSAVVISCGGAGDAASALLVFGSGRDGELGLTEGSSGAAVRQVAEWEKERERQAAGAGSKPRSRFAQLGAAMGGLVTGGGKGGDGAAVMPARAAPPPGDHGRPGPRPTAPSAGTLISPASSVETASPAEPRGLSPTDPSRGRALSPSRALRSVSALALRPLVANAGRALSPFRSMRDAGGRASGTAVGGGDGDDARGGEGDDLRPRSIAVAHRYFSKGSGRALGQGGGARRGGGEEDSSDEEEGWGGEDGGVGVGGAVLDALDERRTPPASVLMSYEKEQRPLSWDLTGISIGALTAPAVEAKGPTLDGSKPLSNTLATGPLPLVSLLRREVRAVACGNGFTVVTVSTEWMRNEDTPSCMRCASAFSLSRRKHHCRQCGGVFCHGCSDHRVPLLALGYIEPVRVCDGCIARLHT